MAELIEFGMWIQVDPRKHVLDGGAHWRHLANMIEPSIFGSDVVLCQITTAYYYYYYYSCYCDYYAV